MPENRLKLVLDERDQLKLQVVSLEHNLRESVPKAHLDAMSGECRTLREQVGHFWIHSSIYGINSVTDSAARR